MGVFPLGEFRERKQEVVRKVQDFLEASMAFSLTPAQREELALLFPWLTDAERESAERTAVFRIYAG